MTKIVHLYASQRVSRRAKDGSDGTSVTIISKSVTYQISASGTEEPKGIWSDKVVETTDTKPYLWTRTNVVYSDTNSTTSYSVSYRGKDGTNGTSFTPKGTATGFFYNMSSVPSYEDGMDSDVYIVNVDDRSNPTSELPPYVCHFEYENFIIEHAEFGDGYNVKGHLYVANSNEWVDFGEIQGAKGEQGEPGIDGKDAINIVFSPAELVFDADENGNLKQAEKSAEIKVYRGITELQYKTDWDNDAEIGDNCRAALLVNTTTNKPEVKISGITSSNIDDVKVPATSGGANVSVIVDGVKYRAYLPFSVNVNTYANFLIRDNKKYISKYTEISNKYTEVSKELDNKANKNDMEEKISTISQKADNIKLEVLSKTSGRRNMLVNSAFRNQDSVFIHSLARIEKNTGLDGVNCIHSSDKYSGTGDGNFIGAFWDSTQKNGVVSNIPIRMGKKYVISCCIKSDNKALPFVIECFFMNSINQQNRGEDVVRKEYHVDNVNEWKRIDFVVDTTDTSEYASKVTPYLAVNFWSNTKNVPKATGATEYPTCHAYICKPMMEEGDTYGGWTLSEDDYEYVGGNMIDNARTLEVGGSLKSLNPNGLPDYERSYYGDSMSIRIKNTNANNTYLVMEFATDSMELDVDYIFSFLAKGKANIGFYAQCDINAEGDSVFSEDSVNQDTRLLNFRYASIIEIPNQLTTQYKRYWGHMRFHGHLPSKLYIQLNGAGEVYVCQPKLEKGATMTEFTERKTDLVDNASLKKAGIEITTNQVKLYGDKVQVLTRKDGNSEYVEAGLFVNGKLNANLIDADKIEVKHLWAKSEDGTNKVGYFGNYEIEACKVNNANAPLFVGADTAAKSPFYVTNKGHMVSTSATLGCFLLDKTSLRYKSGYDDEEPGFALFNNFLLFREYSRTFNPDTHTWKSERKRTVWLGEYKTTHQVPALLSNILIDDSFSVNGDTLKSGIRISVTGCDDSQQYDNPTYNLSNAVYGNFAIYAEHGMFAGFRPMTRTINRSMELTEMDCYVEVTDAVTLTLPKNPQRGQTYWIMRSVDKGVNTIVKGNGKKIYTPFGNGDTATFTTPNEIIWLTYIKDNWKAIYIKP